MIDLGLTKIAMIGVVALVVIGPEKLPRVARMAGSQYPDEWVMRGNHHDAWVNGANDPLSGLVAELPGLVSTMAA